MDMRATQPLLPLERNFINTFQGGFPLHKHPFKIAGEQLGCSESDLIKTITELKHKKILTRFGPLYDAARLGGGLTLAAICVPEERYDEIAEVVNAFPEIAHNYRREHQLNMWFVIATETPIEIIQVISEIETTTQLTVYNFPKQHEFFIGLWFNISKNAYHETISPPGKQMFKDSDDYSISTLDRKIIKQTQAGLTLNSRPFHEVAKKTGHNEDEIIERLKTMLDYGVIRRIGAVPNHFKLGFKANGMTVWDVPNEKVLELGEQIGQLDFVSHSYQRPRHQPIWNYNLFAMVHGHTREAVENKTRQIKDILGKNCHANDILYSSAILKKTGLRLAV